MIGLGSYKNPLYKCSLPLFVWGGGTSIHCLKEPVKRVTLYVVVMSCTLFMLIIHFFGFGVYLTVSYVKIWSTTSNLIWEYINWVAKLRCQCIFEPSLHCNVYQTNRRHRTHTWSPHSNLGVGWPAISLTRMRECAQVSLSMQENARVSTTSIDK